MTKPLVIVESPAKARTISRLLGSEYVVESSIGHIRDLPRGAAEIPSAYKSEAWARLGVDTENGFKPIYVVSREKKEQVRRLKELLKNANELYLATDEDREGESIAWHLLEVLSPTVPVKRMVFHEITAQAIEEAVRDTREIDRKLVDAQETRRILDRLYGYEVSPVLWRKVMPKLSAGRVQSVTCRILVERERARMSFKSAGYYDLKASLGGKQDRFTARLIEVASQRLAQGKDFDESGLLVSRAASQGVLVVEEELANSLVGALSSAQFQVSSIDEKPYRRSPAPPFMTSTLQQEAGRKLRFPSSRTMSVAQRLYENGHITYMRTDATYLSKSAEQAAREVVKKLFGLDYVPSSPRSYKNKVKNAQEAHEAIRPSGDVWKSPESLSNQLDADELKLYDLIYKRTLACQMTDAIGTTVSARVTASTTDAALGNGHSIPSGSEAVFSASGRTISFPGFLRIYVEDSDDVDREGDSDEAVLPQLAMGQTLVLAQLNSDDHSTQAPPRYTEASLVKALEEMGVGRPSTYASIISTILDRGYAWKKGQALVPSFLAFAVVKLLEEYFSSLVDYNFTASMEDALDAIAEGELEALPYLSEFYFGSDSLGLKRMVEGRLPEIDPREVNTISLGTTDDGTDVVVRVGKFGPFVQVATATASIPDDMAPDELTIARALQLISDAEGADRTIGNDPITDTPIHLRAGRYGPYVQLGESEGKAKAKTSSLLSYMDPKTLSLDDAVALLSLPRVVGRDPQDDQEILAQGGRFGAYLSKGKETRSLASDEEIFTASLEQALALFAEPKSARGRRQADPGRLIGEDESISAQILLRSGRFGPYVTDGSVNASLPKGMSEEELTLDAAMKLLFDRREKLALSPKTSKRVTKGAKRPKSTKSPRGTKS